MISSTFYQSLILADRKRLCTLNSVLILIQCVLNSTLTLHVLDNLLFYVIILKFVSVWERENVCVCVSVWKRERVRVSVCEKERESVWERERERECVCVCVCAHVCVHARLCVWVCLQESQPNRNCQGFVLFCLFFSLHVHWSTETIREWLSWSDEITGGHRIAKYAIFEHNE